MPNFPFPPHENEHKETVPLRGPLTRIACERQHEINHVQLSNAPQSFV